MEILGFESPTPNYGFFFFFFNACSWNLEPHLPHPRNQIISKIWDKFYFGPWNFFYTIIFYFVFNIVLPLLNYMLNDKLASRIHTPADQGRDMHVQTKSKTWLQYIVLLYLSFYSPFVLISHAYIGQTKSKTWLQYNCHISQGVFIWRWNK